MIYLAVPADAATTSTVQTTGNQLTTRGGVLYAQEPLRNEDR